MAVEKERNEIRLKMISTHCLCNANAYILPLTYATTDVSPSVIILSSLKPMECLK